LAQRYGLLEMEVKELREREGSRSESP